MRYLGCSLNEWWHVNAYCEFASLEPNSQKPHFSLGNKEP